MIPADYPRNNISSSSGLI